MRRMSPVAMVAAGAVLILAACSSAGASRSPGDTALTGTNPSAPVLTIAPSLPTQTDTSWGRIWDGVPDSFFIPTGAEPATDPGDGPSSAQLVVTASASDVADEYVAGLHTAGWTVTKDGPLEDGSVVVNATNAGACKAQVTVHSIGDASLVAILFGAGCAFE